jgi:GNAT superfamily N-acetyltransferase
VSEETTPTSGYRLRQGSGLDRALLLKFMRRTYAELYGDRGLSHLSQTVDRYLSSETPLWWVDWASAIEPDEPNPSRAQPIACLWMGTAIDQVEGDQHAHIFLLYVHPDHRRQGIGTMLMNQAEQWAKQRGDRQIGLLKPTCDRLIHKVGLQTPIDVVDQTASLVQ